MYPLKITECRELEKETDIRFEYQINEHTTRSGSARIDARGLNVSTIDGMSREQLRNFYEFMSAHMRSFERARQPTDKECLEQLGGLAMFSMLAGSEVVKSAAEWAAEIKRPEHGFEVREESRNYGQTKTKAVGIVEGPTLYRQAR